MWCPSRLSAALARCDPREEAMTDKQQQAAREQGLMGLFAEMQALIGVLPTAMMPLAPITPKTAAERAAEQEEIEAGFDNMPV